MQMQNFPIIFLANGAQLGYQAARQMESVMAKPRHLWTLEEYRFIADMQASQSTSPEPSKALQK
jgi:hypothetical protein